MALENVGDAVTLNDKQTEKQLSPEGTPTDTQNAVSGFRTKLKLPEYRRRCLRTLWLGLSFCALGFAVGQRGPAFLDIQIITQTDVKSASFFFTAASVGYLVGSLTAGMVYDKLNKSLLLIMSLLGLSFTTIALPWCSPYVLMIMIHFLCSMCAGSVDTVGNAELVRIWGNEGEMAMQFLHFAFAFGGVISPLITAPFLTPVPEEDGQGVWVCTVLAGISMSSIFPTGFLWMEEEFVRVTGRVASSILVASSSGTMVNPIALGALMQNLTPMCRLYLRKHYIISEVRTLEIVAPTLAVDGDTTHETADV
ncbi:hypothetical protein C0Q70_09648 [Pomacea canaliculata]|uniref:Major facilitator superfamily (MFS) profile domain-containing protein n=1 Tax=Pomacea canaliculata TaxID=400727 RepID=A0A2T7PAE6_POMCA|nr:hypothetical protein C0Q70_09648 [Pomacea canaliculata]